jgi:hypothetical protein
MKKCTKCGIEKLLTEFHKKISNKDGHRRWCKSCVSEYCAIRYRSEPGEKQRQRENSRKWYLKNKDKPERKEKNRAHYRKWYYKNSEEEPACIYQILNIINRKVYIGETTRGEQRWKRHLRDLKADRHKNPTLQQDFNEHGEEAFVWSIIKQLPKDKEMLILEEAKEIQRRIDDGNDLYNKIIPKEGQ